VAQEGQIHQGGIKFASHLDPTSRAHGIFSEILLLEKKESAYFEKTAKTKISENL